jgi:hypothetical protein
MAFNKAPTAIFPGYSSDGTDITIPIADLDGLTAAEANATTGDWREIIYAICVTAFKHYNDLATADKPVAFIASPPSRYAVTSGDLSGTFRESFTFQFYNEYAEGDVVDEPAA